MAVVNGRRYARWVEASSGYTAALAYYADAVRGAGDRAPRPEMNIVYEVRLEDGREWRHAMSWANREAERQDRNR